MSLLNFNASEVAPSTGFDPIPAGKYVAVISDSEMRLEFTIIDGEYANRKLWTRLNLDNPNPDAVRLARADLSAICHAVHVLTPQDSVELHNLPLVIGVRCKKTADGEIVNEIRSYSAREQMTASENVSKTQNAAPPWARK